MVTNSLGFVPIMDGGNPRMITGIAKEAISGGEYVFASGANNVVSSGANSFVSSDLEIATGASGAQCNGVAIGNAGSTGAIAFMSRGVVLSTANGTVTAGFPLQVDGNNSVANLGSATIAAGTFGKAVGRALTSAASGGHCLVNLNL